VEKTLILRLQEHGNMARSQTPKKTQRRDEGDRYLELVRQVPLRPIRSEAELDRAIAMIDALLDQDKRRSD